MNAIIREAELGDIEALCALNAEVQELHVAHRPDVFRPIATPEIAGRFRDLFAQPTTKIWVAVVDGSVRGYLVAILRRPAAPNPYVLERSWLELDQIGVSAEHRRLGIARGLVERALAHAQAEGIAGVELSSWSFNQNAHRAFEKLGFVSKSVRFEWVPPESE